MCTCDLCSFLSVCLACFNVSIDYVNWLLTRVMNSIKDLILLSLVP